MDDELGEFGELEGEPANLIYHCHFIGGPRDGEIANCFRPYHYLCVEGHEYFANEKTEYVQWESDGSRRIDLFYKGKENS